MNNTSTALTNLFNQIPRRHSPENVKEITRLLSEYESILIEIEAMNAHYETIIPVYFDELEEVRSGIKKSNDQKTSKKMKDNLFDEASGALKDSMQQLISVFGDGTHTE